MTHDGFLLLQAAIVTTVCNLTSDSRDRFSTEKRVEGWTEVFGDGKVDNKECWKHEEDALLESNSNILLPDNSSSVTLLQYRPAWLEQVVLRMAGIPHVVVNSSYASTESTGPLPVLQDNSGGALSPPVRVGRCQPGIQTPESDDDDDNDEVGATKELSDKKKDHPHTRKEGQNSILDYLKLERGVDLNKNLVDPTDSEVTKRRKATSSLLMMLLKTKLQRSLMVLRYEDGTAWSQVYKKQCFAAASKAPPLDDLDDNHLTSQTKGLWSQFPTMMGWYQAWSERVMARRTLMGSNRNRNSSVLEHAKREARKGYEILEQQLSQRHNNHPYLLDTSQPVFVDAVLWAHLAEALCDIKLVMILADFPLLIEYFQFMHQTYFAIAATTKDDTTTTDTDDYWQLWNKHQNSINCFQQIPLFQSDNDAGQQQQQQDKLKNVKTAVELMKTLSAHDRDLVKVLQEGKAARAPELLLAKQRRIKPASSQTKTLEADDDEEKKEITAAQKARLQQQRSDQYWLGAVAMVALAGVVSIVAATDDK